MRLLVVEDEEDLASALAAGLRQEGYAVDVAVDVAGDGAQALDRLSYTPCDLVLLDIAMPRVDGWTVLRDLRADADATGHPPPRVLVLNSPRLAARPGPRPGRRRRRLPRQAVLVHRARRTRLSAPAPRQQRQQRRRRRWRPSTATGRAGFGRAAR